jgi:membrane protein
VTDARSTARAVLSAFSEHRILVFANAIAFRIAFALVPLTLATLGVLGSFDLQDKWRNQLAPEVSRHVSVALFLVIDDTVTQVLQAKQLWWATLGAGLAIWQVSAAVRAVMAVLDSLYDVEDERPPVPRYTASIGLAVVAIALLLGAVATIQFGDGLVGGPLGTFARWVVALALLTLLIALLSRYAPAERRPWRLASRGGAVTIACWIVTSLVFGVYLREIASYGSVFGNLATVMIALEYLYLSVVAFLTGLLLDRVAQEELAPASVTGSSGPRPV